MMHKIQLEPIFALSCFQASFHVYLPYSTCTCTREFWEEKSKDYYHMAKSDYCHV
jgi:hypothetical protein